MSKMKLEDAVMEMATIKDEMQVLINRVTAVNTYLTKEREKDAKN